MKRIVVTGSDANYFLLLKDAIRSILDAGLPAQTDLGVMDFGLEDAQRAWLEDLGAVIATPVEDIPMRNADPSRPQTALTCRPFLARYFPHHDALMWFDCDAWLQDRSALSDYLDAAAGGAFVFVREGHRAYRRRPRLFLWRVKHGVVASGLVDGLKMAAKPSVNAGFFAGPRDHPVFGEWAVALTRVVAKTGTAAPYDQFALNHVLSRTRGALRELDPTRNWICEHATPVWDAARSVYVTPGNEDRAIGILHLAGEIKTKRVPVRDRTGGQMTKSLLYRDNALAPAPD
ncbi:MAG: hypothetical protein AAGC56_07075 [Pseudomonadota bacterium]